MDFTIDTYKTLLLTLQKQNYEFQTFSEFLLNPCAKSIILRHDVDLNPLNSLRFAEIQYNFGIRGSYYFRVTSKNWDLKIIKRIASLGHEIGYHYENLATCKGDIDSAYADFCSNLEDLRKLADVKTICMHGSPRSIYDSKDIWKKYNYKKLGIIGEPYFDINFDDVLYLSDTGRRWDGFNVSIRDKIPKHQETWNRKNLMFHSTEDIIRNTQKLPNQIMFNFHPQRWHDSKVLWTKEIIFQNIKNCIKALIIKSQNI